MVRLPAVVYATVAAMAVAAPRSQSGSVSDATPTNVVFFLVDDLGWADVSPNNPDTFYRTPNVQRLADTGMTFTQAYAACPVCSPTRASIVSGKYPARLATTDYFGAPQPERAREMNGWRDRPLFPASYVDRLVLEEVTIAEALREAGYGTWFGGKWHLGGEGLWPTDQGFDVNVGGFHAGHPKSYFSPYQNPNLADGPDGEYLTNRLTDEAIGWLQGRAGEDAAEPFLLYLAYYNVHTPLQAEPEVVERYRARKEELQIDGPLWGQEGARKVRLVQEHAVYAAMVEAVDRSVGRILDALDALGLADDTLVVFFSDNGGLSTSEGHPTSNLPLRAGKGWIYEGGIREPCFVRLPGVTAPGSLCDTPVISTDFYPTILEATGQELRPEQHVDGRSLLPLLRGEPGDPTRALFWHYPHWGNQGGGMASAIRKGRWKLIEHHVDGRLELFDLERDIGESRDLVADHPELVRTLHAELCGWRQGVAARMPERNPAAGR